MKVVEASDVFLWQQTKATPKKTLVKKSPKQNGTILLFATRPLKIAKKYLSKGDRVYIEGKIKTRKWQDDGGNDRYSTEINVDDFAFNHKKQ